MALPKVFNKPVRIGPSNLKASIPIFAKAKCIYLFACNCGDSYIGRTDRRLDCRVKEHIPDWLINKKSGQARSAITKHLVSSGHTVDRYSCFQILNKQYHSSLLKLAEACYIRKLKPVLCVQKQFVTPLSLPWG